MHKRVNSHQYIFDSLNRCMTIQGLLFVFKVLGLSPWKVNKYKISDKNKDNQRNLVESSNYGCVYNILLIIILSAICATVIELGLWKEEYMESDLVNKIDLCLMIYGISLIVIVWLNYVLLQKKIVNIVNKLYSIYDNLMICNRYNFKSDYRLYIFPLLNLFLCGSLVIVDMVKSGIYITIIWSTPLIISSWVLMQYTLLLNIIFQLLKCMSMKILELGDIDMENYYRTMLRSKISLREFAIKDINFIKYAIMQLCEICDQIADFYAIPLLMIVVYSITRAIFDIYYLIVSLFLLDESDLIKIYFFVGILCLIISFNLIVFTSNITRITREVCLDIE